VDKGFCMVGLSDTRPGLCEFPRIVVGGNSPHCIKTEADEGHDHYDSSPLPTTDRVLPFQPQILLL